MSKIELNKPLFDTPDSRRYARAAASPSNKPAAPQEPIPGIFGRIGAVIVDFLLLHCVLMLVTVVAHDAVMQLGIAGRWVGLAFGILYFTVGYSRITQGRTLGKMLLHLQVCDLNAKLISPARALLRALALLWPLVVYCAAGQYGEHLDANPENFAWPANAWIVAGSLMVSYALANILFSSFDVAGRSVYDYVTGTAQVCTSAPTAMQEELVRRGGERTLLSKPVNRLFVTAIVITLLIPGLMARVLIQQKNHLAQLPAEDIELLRSYNHAVSIPAYRVAGQGNSIATADDTATTAGAAAANDEQTSVASLLMVTRTRSDLDTLKANPKVLEMPETYAQFFRQGLERTITVRDNPAELRAKLPQRLRFRVAFAELADLFFAWNVEETFAVARTIELHLGNDDAQTTSTE